MKTNEDQREADELEIDRAHAHTSPEFLNRIEVYRAAQGTGLTTEAVVKRLQSIMNAGSDANALRAVEQLRKLVDATKDEVNPSGRTTINGNVNFGADLEKLNDVLKTVDASTRKQILDTLTGGQVIDVDS
jgi:hypothetical protein